MILSSVSSKSVSSSSSVESGGTDGSAKTSISTILRFRIVKPAIAVGRSIRSSGRNTSSFSTR